jgi:hypothetical protein
VLRKKRLRRTASNPEDVKRYLENGSEADPSEGLRGEVSDGDDIEVVISEDDLDEEKEDSEDEEWKNFIVEDDEDDEVTVEEEDEN